MAEKKAPKLKKLLPGDTIFNEGEPGKKVYIIKEGEVKIVAQKEDKVVTLGKLSNGACFGEMAVINDAPRSASAIAHSQVSLYEIDKTTIDSMIGALPPLFRAIVASLIKRVTSLNDYATEKASITHPLSSMAHLIILVNSQNPEPPQQDMGMIQEDTSEKLEDIEVAALVDAARDILGYTESGTVAILERLAALKLATIETKNRKKIFSFKRKDFEQNVSDLIVALGDASHTGLSAKLEYIDLKDFADQLGVDPKRLIDSICSGRIPPEACVLKSSVVEKSIQSQGRMLF